jgi:ParB family chromosome partitioning protein
MSTVSIKAVAANPFQSRAQVEGPELDLLVQSIKQHGWWPTKLRARAVNGGYELAYGHRRLAALKKLGHREIDLDVVRMNDLEMAESSLIENCQRENLSDVDKSEAIRRLVDMLLATKEWKDRDTEAQVYVGKLLGYQPSSIKKFLNISKMSEPTKRTMREQNTSWHVADRARQIGGEPMVRHVAKARINRTELDRMAQALSELPVERRQKVVDRVLKDKSTTGDEVTRLVRREAAKVKPRGKSEKPEVDKWMLRWQMTLEDLHSHIKDVLPFKKDIHEYYPARIAKFRDAWDELKSVVEELLRKTK